MAGQLRPIKGREVLRKLKKAGFEVIRIKNPAASSGVSKELYNNFPQSCHPRMFLSGVQSEVRLDSRYKHAGMTDLKKTWDRHYAASCGELNPYRLKGHQNSLMICEGYGADFYDSTIFIPSLVPPEGIKSKTQAWHRAPTVKPGATTNWKDPESDQKTLVAQRQIE